MTPTQLLLLPVFLHVALVFYVLFRSGLGRVRAVKSGLVKRSEIDTNRNAYPEPVRNFSNNYQNQFELPVLYYALLPLLLATSAVDPPFIVLSWTFVAARFVHSFVHTGTNVISTRFKVFVFGMICIALMWAWFALRFFVIG